MSSLNDLVNYRIARAKEALKEAQTLGDSALWNGAIGAINRLYYACFYIADALLISHKISHKNTCRHKTPDEPAFWKKQDNTAGRTKVLQ